MKAEDLRDTMRSLSEAVSHRVKQAYLPIVLDEAQALQTTLKKRKGPTNKMGAGKPKSSR